MAQVPGLSALLQPGSSPNESDSPVLGSVGAVDTWPVLEQTFSDRADDKSFIAPMNY